MARDIEEQELLRALVLKQLQQKGQASSGKAAAQNQQPGSAAESAIDKLFASKQMDKVDAKMKDDKLSQYMQQPDMTSGDKYAPRIREENDHESFLTLPVLESEVSDEDKATRSKFQQMMRGLGRK
jgi:hypothetical protein